MNGNHYSLQGKVVRSATQQGVADLRVEIWLRMPAQDQRLGEITSDQNGGFEFDFQQSSLTDLFLGHPPDVYFRIFQGSEALPLASASDLVWKTIPEDGKAGTVELQVELPAPEPTYTVSGTIRNESGQPLESVLVKAFAIISPVQDTLLGEQPTDKAGCFEILYKPSQFRETGRQNADLIVRVYAKSDSPLLLTSPTYFQAPSPLTINLGGEPPQPSEYETLLSEITHLLHQTPLAELTPEAIAFLTAKTELDPQAIAFLALSGRLAQETKLPQAAFYGFFRQQLPTSLLPLLAYGRAEWQEALDTALAKNLIPASLRSSRDSILDRFQQMAEEADAEEPDPGRPKIRLNYRLLGRSILDNLQSNDPSRNFINATLNATLKRVLSDAFSHEGYAVLAAFCETLPESDLAAQAGVSVRSFMAIQIEAVLQGDRLGIASTLKAALQDLSATTTIGQLLGLESSLQDHPLFQDEAKQLSFRTLLNTSPVLANRQLQDTFIRQYRANRGTIERFWQEILPEAQGFQDLAVVRETQLTLQLGRLTQHNMSLLRTLQEMRRERSHEFQTTRYLTRLSLTEWKRLIHSSVPAGTEPEIPATIPGKTVEEKVANYATSLATQLERAYPTDFVFQAQGLRDIPGIDPPTLHYLLLFFAQSPDFDFRQVRVDSYLKEQGETALQNIPDQDRAKVKLQLKRLERVFQVAPRPAQMQVLLKEKLDSAYSIASVPFKAFMGRFAGKLGGDEAAEAIYNNAQNITATTMQAFISMYQTQFDVTPFVLQESESSASRQARLLSQHVLRGAGASTSIKANATWEAFFWVT